jgi:hypothetical protein
MRAGARTLTLDERGILLRLLAAGEQCAAHALASVPHLEAMHRQGWVLFRDGHGSSKHRPAEKIFWRVSPAGAVKLASP